MNPQQADSTRWLFGLLAFTMLCSRSQEAKSTRRANHTRRLARNAVDNTVRVSERSGWCGMQGTVVTAGRARCIVVGTGTTTAIGKIHGAMTEAVRLLYPVSHLLYAGSGGAVSIALCSQRGSRHVLMTASLPLRPSGEQAAPNHVPKL